MGKTKAATQLHAGRGVFVTPEQYAREQAHRMETTRGRLLIASCRAGAYLAEQIVQRYEALATQAGGPGDVLYLAEVDYRFSDSEACVRLDVPVNGDDVFIIQALFDPATGGNVDQNYMAFLIAARTFREQGASHVTAVLPYLAYGRQDKPTRFMREPTTARLMADLSIAAGVDALITWAPHRTQIRGFYGSIPVDMLTPLTLFVEVFDRFRGRDDVIVVAPDAGASKAVTHLGRALDLKCAIASKHRPQQEEAVVTEVIGDFAHKRVALVLDDMISSGGTVYALVKRLVEEGGIEEVYLGVSHNLCMASARDRLVELHADYKLKQVVVTNSVPQTRAFRSLPFLEVRCLSDTLCRIINRIHYNRSVSELFYRE